VSNPTRDRLETNLAALEGGIASRVFGSGMAAINAITTMLKSGDHIVAGHNLYGGTPRLFNQVLVQLWTDIHLRRYIRPQQSRERVSEEHAAGVSGDADQSSDGAVRPSRHRELSHRHGAEVVVDNTFMSPYFQRPIEFGADMVVHSTTKFLNGHSDGLGGVVVCTKPEQAEKLAFIQNARARSVSI
jgi:cystathionine beta-lyase/cystathionine gamma-synthase